MWSLYSFCGVHSGIRALSKVQPADNFLQCIGTAAKLSDFFIRERNVDLAADAVASDAVERTEANIIDSVLAVHKSRNGHCGFDAGMQAFANMTYRRRNSIESCTFAGNNSSAGFFYISLNLCKVKRGTYHAGSCDKLRAILNRHSGNICNRPRNEGRIAVFTEYICMYIGLIDIIILRQPCTQARCVQNGARTNDMVCRKSGLLEKHICQDVNRIADDDINRIRRIFCYLRQNGFCDVDVGLRKLKTGLSGLAGNAGSQNNDIGTCRIAVIARIDGAIAAEK